MDVPFVNTASRLECTSHQGESCGNKDASAAVVSRNRGDDWFEWWLFDKYGPTLGMTELAALLHHTVGTLDQKVRAGQCPVPTYKEGGHRVADVRDVISYLNQRRKEAQAAYQSQQDLLKIPKGL